MSDTARELGIIGEQNSKNSRNSTRSHLTENEIKKLLKVAKEGRYGQRDHLMVLMAFRHGLRVSELCDLQWSDIDFKPETPMSGG